MRNIVTLLRRLSGIELTPVSHAEKIVSAVGGFVAILCIFVISQSFVGMQGAGVIVASFGASAVLLFAVPHGQLSQPWAVLGGHVISAIIGVACAQAITNEIIAASAAVGLAIGAMYYLRCVHPPGGATALSAVIGGEATHALGYQFVITPVLLNALVILAVALLYNYLFSWRRYPVYLQQRGKSHGDIPAGAGQGEITHGDFVYALSQADSFVDVSEYDLLRIYELATNRSHSTRIYPGTINLGDCYSNGRDGDEWSVRQVVDESPSADIEKDMLVYKVVAGSGLRSSECVTRIEFARWARHRVIKEEENWKVVTPDNQ